MSEKHLEANHSEPSLSSEEDRKKRGKLKIFFGMCSGVGKTFAMLRAAQLDLSRGVDVVIGRVDSHNQPDVSTLLNDFDVIPTNKLTGEDGVVQKIDLDAIILRHPYLVVIDELAHKNVDGSRHAKRYQDVLELLDNGINVYTTLNIQNIESRSDIIAKITGVVEHDTIPDEIFEMADDVELVDVTASTLLDRLAEGKVASHETEETTKSFFRKGNITALREMSLRLVADRVDKQLKTYMQEKRIEGPWKSGLHLLVLVGPSKSSAKLIRWAKNLSYTMGADLVALHVENTQVLDEAQQEQLTKNMELARQLGAEIIVTSGDDLVSTTLDVARQENITHLIIGKSGKQSFFSSLLGKDNFVNRLLKESGDIDIYVIEPGFEAKQYKKKLLSNPDFSSPPKDYFISLLSVFVAVMLCLPIASKIGYQPVSFILLFVVLILSMFFRLGPVMLASAVSAISWNFFFIPPQFAIKISKPEDVLACCMFFIVAFITGTLTSKIRKHVILSRKREDRTNALLHLTNDLANADNSKAIIEATRTDIKKYFGIDCYFFLKDENGKLKKKQSNDKSKRLSDAEYEVAQWVFKHLKKAGKFTDTLSSSDYTFYPLKGTKTKPGVIVLKMNTPFNGETQLFWDVFLTQISNTLEHHQFAQLVKNTTFSDESEKLYKTFFEAVSSELKTPISAIVEESKVLLDKLSDLNHDEKDLCRGISRNSHYLQSVIDNLLNVYHLENGKVFTKFDWCDIKDVFDRVAKELDEDLKPFHLDVVVPENMPSVKIDATQMTQVLSNLVYNSCKYSKPGATIRLKAFYDNGSLVVQEMDRGIGFSPECLPLVFTKFFKGEACAMNTFGLGLFVAKGLVEAHQGVICVENRQNGGARFTIKIPTEIAYKNNVELI